MAFIKPKIIVLPFINMESMVWRLVTYSEWNNQQNIHNSYISFVHFWFLPFISLYSKWIIHLNEPLIKRGENWGEVSAKMGKLNHEFFQPLKSLHRTCFTGSESNKMKTDKKRQKNRLCERIIYVYETNMAGNSRISSGGNQKRKIVVLLVLKMSVPSPCSWHLH